MEDGEILFGIAGILAGAISTGAIDGVSRWHQRRLAKRAAARVIYADLRWARDVLESALSVGDCRDMPRFQFEDWHRYRDALSDSMPASGFHAVAGAFYGLKVLAQIREAGGKFQVESWEDSLLQVCKAGDLVIGEGLTRRDIREMASSEVPLDIEPGDACLVFGLHGSSQEVEAKFIGPAAYNDDESEKVRVEFKGVRYEVSAENIRMLSADDSGA